MKRLAFYLVAATILVADQVTKAWALRDLADRGSLPVAPGYLALTFVRNRGSAFGLAPAGAMTLAAIAAIAIVAMIFAERRGLRDWSLVLCVGLLLGGATGNLIDRLRLGFVVDFVDLQWHGRNFWPVFNVADSAITVGAVWLILHSWRREKQASPGKPAEAGPA